MLLNAVMLLQFEWVDPAKCVSSASPAGWASAGCCTDVALDVPLQWQTCEGGSYWYKTVILAFAWNILKTTSDLLAFFHPLFEQVVDKVSLQH